MNITLKHTKEDELNMLMKIEDESFQEQAKCFENGMLPPLSEEEKEEFSLTTLFAEKDTTVLSIFGDEHLIGGTVVKVIDKDTKEIVLFFISPNYQGNGLGRQALQMVEDYFPDTKLWHLITPTQVLRNSVFYVNKCGYHIVRIDEFDKQKEHGVFVFEKRK